MTVDALADIEERKQRAKQALAHALARDQARDFAGAAAAYRAFLALAPGHAEAHNNLGSTLSRLGDTQAAIEAFRAAIALKPELFQPYLNLAAELRRLGRAEEALPLLEKARALRPDNIETLATLATIYDEFRRGDEAEACRTDLLAREPDHLGARCESLRRAMAGCDFAAIETHLAAREASLARMIAAQRRPGTLSIVPYQALFHPLPDPLARATTSRINALLSERVPPVAQASRDLDPERRLRIAYLSPQFGNHPVGQVTCSLYAAHDRRAVEVFAYALGARTREGGPFHAMIRKGVDHFLDLPPSPPDNAARRIAADAIDIVIDLDGYMDATCPPILAHRPAPVQAYWLGHAGGLGLDFVDYLIADRVVVPPGEEALYTEKIARLPEVYHPADRPPIGATPTREQEGLDPDAVVFCAFNNPEKIDRAIFAAWMRILHGVPGGQLWVSGPTRFGDAGAKLREEAVTAGIDPRRIVSARYLPDKRAHLARHRLADLFLDTITLNAATTALDALWAGLPMLTRKGDRWANRMAESFLSALGLAEWVAPDLDAYVAHAIALGHDAPAREAMRARLAEAVATRPLFKVERLARHLEAAYRTMWRRHVAGDKPAGFDVPVMA